MIERKNVETLEQSLLQIQYITSLFQLANKSFTHGDYSKGLNQISAVENLLKGLTMRILLMKKPKNISKTKSY